MHVKKDPSGDSHRYYLGEWISENGQRKQNLLYSYGHESPTFYEPDFHNARCENKLTTLPEECVDLIIDDPPYGRTNAKWDTEPDWDELTKLYDRVLSEYGTFVIFGKQPSLMPVYDAFTNDGFEFRFELIWRKQNNPWVSDQQPIPIHENLFVFSKKGVRATDLTFNIDDVKRDGIFVCPRCEQEIERGSYTVTRTNEDKSSTQNYWQDSYTSNGTKDRYPISVLEYDSVHGNSDEYRGYAGQKPLKLLRWLIMAMSNRGDMVLDPHAGSGSTLMASIPLCRESIGVEVDQERYEDAKQRVGEMIEEVSGLKHAEVIPSDLSTDG